MLLLLLPRTATDAVACTHMYPQLLRLGPATLDGQALGAEYDPPLGSPAAEEAAFERYSQVSMAGALIVGLTRRAAARVPPLPSPTGCWRTSWPRSAASICPWRARLLHCTRGCMSPWSRPRYAAAVVEVWGAAS